MRAIAIKATCFGVIAGIFAPLAIAFEQQIRTFERSGLVITVTGMDSDYSDTRSYQVVVADGLRTLSRLEVNRDGLVTDAWLTDLDTDGAFEIVVATSLLEDTEPGGVDIHEWDGTRFHSTTAARVPPAARAFYRGNDQFSVENGHLWRSFPRFEVGPPGSNPAPTGEMAKFRYRLGENRWEPVEP